MLERLKLLSETMSMLLHRTATHLKDIAEAEPVGNGFDPMELMELLQKKTPPPPVVAQKGVRRKK